MALRGVAETDAGPELRELYSDIRRVLGTPSVNLVWRHLATRDGALPWVWRKLRPLYLDPELGAAGDALRRTTHEAVKQLELPTSSANLAGDEYDVIRKVLSSYQRTNPENLIALKSLLRCLQRGGRRPSGKPPIASRDPASAPSTLPELVRPEDMSDSTYASALRLESLVRSEPATEVVAGVPRHLARWPSFLDHAVSRVAAAEAGLIELATEVDAKAEKAASHFDLGLGSEVPSCAEFVAGALEAFTARDMIASYIAKVALLLEDLSEPTYPSSVK